MTFSNKTAVATLIIDEQQAGRRIDNVLTAHLKHVPKTRIYRMIRKGEVRVNSKRIKQDYRLQLADTVRIPPVHAPEDVEDRIPPERLQQDLAKQIIYQDKDLLVLNKPAGLAVHSGSQQEFGVIEVLRTLLPEEKNLELVHRLDKGTSGCLLLAKNYPALRELHEIFRQNKIEKEYLALLKGPLRKQQLDVQQPLKRTGTQAGDRPVRVTEDGKLAKTSFMCQQNYSKTSLVQALIETGRTHQIRVHAAHIGHPVAGDPKYGDFEFNREMKKFGLRRMFLHARQLSLQLPGRQKKLLLTAPLPEELSQFLQNHR